MEEVQRAAADYREAQAQLDAVRERLEAAIRDAAQYKTGTYRRIAEATGIWSHEQVRKIVKAQVLEPM